MAYDRDKHDRRSMRMRSMRMRSMRMRGYDYASAGAHFITICTQGRVHLFGTVAGGAMHENACEKIARAEWMHTGGVRENVALDAFVVMPNHVHGIIVITHDEHGGNAARGGDAAPGRRGNKRTFGGAKPGTLSTVMRQYKSIVTKRIRQTVRPDFAWQRGFYDRIIRTDRKMKNVRRYIAENPARWAADRLNG